MKDLHRARLVTTGQFVVWWAANSLYAVDVQKVLRRFSDAPLLFIDLALLQVVVGIAMATCIRHWRASGKGESTGSTSGELNIFKGTNLIIGCLHISAVMLTNFSYGSIGSTSTLVWKLTEPFAAIVLKYMILKEVTEVLSMAGVTLVVIGVLTYSVKSMGMFAASPIVLSNILFPTRNVVVKLSQKQSTQHVSTEKRYSDFLYSSLPLALGVWTLKVYWELPSVETLPLLFRNAVMFNLYQFASIALLEKLDALTHSLANTMKRFLGILLSAFLLRETFSLRHILGLVLTAIGFYLYSFASRQKTNKVSRSHVQLVVLVLVLFVPFALLSTSASPTLEDWSIASAKEKVLGITGTPKTSDTQEVVDKMPQIPTTAVKHEHEVPHDLDSSSEQKKYSAYLNSLETARPDMYVLPRKYPNMDDYALDENDIWSYKGVNVGNLVWARAGLHLLPDFSPSIHCQEAALDGCLRMFAKNESLKEALLYWPAANVFHEDGTHSFHFLSKRVHTGMNVLMVGAGMQANFAEGERDIKDSEKQRTVATERFQHHNKTLEFLSDMERNQQTIMVRGEVTLRTLRDAGYTHGISTGCPSLFLNKEVRLGRLMEKKYEDLKNRIGDRSLRIGINLANYQVYFQNDFLYKVFYRYPESIIFAQGRADLITLERNNIPKSRVRMFNDIEKWRAELQTMDVVMGARIHGSMMALGSSVPVFVVAPDYRVLELVERMQVPHTTVFDKRLKGDFDVAELIYNERMNGTSFDNNRCGIAKTYRSVFGRFGFGVSNHVFQISEIC